MKRSTLIYIFIGIMILVGGAILLNLLLTRSKTTSQHTVTLNEAGLSSVSKIIGIKNNDFYYLSNNNLFKRDLNSNQVTLVAKNIGDAKLSDDNRILSYRNGLSMDRYSTTAVDLQANTKKDFPDTFTIFWLSNQLFLYKKTGELTFSITDESGKLIYPSEAFNVLFGFANQYLVFNQGESASENPPLNVYNVVSKKNERQLAIADSSQGPWSFGNYFGYINSDREFVVYNSSFAKKSISFGVNANQLTKQPSDNQYFITFPSLNPDDPNQKIQFDISKINLDGMQVTEVAKADLPNYLKTLFRDNIGSFNVQQVYFDTARNTFYLLVNGTLYSASGVES